MTETKKKATCPDCAGKLEIYAGDPGVNPHKEGTGWCPKCGKRFALTEGTA